MNRFLDILAERIAERWLTLFTIPGVSYAVAVWVASVLGQEHATDLSRLATHLNAAAAHFSDWSAVAQAVALAFFVLASSGLGLLVGILSSSATLPLWLDQVRGVPGISSVYARRAHTIRKRWDALVARRDELLSLSSPGLPSITGLEASKAHAEALRISSYAPERATWMGNRMLSLEAVLYDHYQLDLRWVWPRLWLVLPQEVRDEIGAAHSSFRSSSVRATWSAFWFALGVLWWPALAVTAVLALHGWRTARDSLATLAEVTEAAIDVHGPSLAVQLGVLPQVQRLTPEVGDIINRIASKNR